MRQSFYFIGKLALLDRLIFLLHWTAYHHPGLGQSGLGSVKLFNLICHTPTPTSVYFAPNIFCEPPLICYTCYNLQTRRPRLDLS